MELNSAICDMPWCKATFQYQGDKKPDSCPKCRSFNNDLSGGVVWVEKKYEGSRIDGMSHLIDIKVERAGEKRKIW